MYNRRLIFWSACAAILFFGMAITTLGSIVPDLRNKFGLDEIAIGTLFTILPFGILTGSLLFGPLADKFGFRILLALSCISLFVGFEGIAFAHSYWQLQGSVFLFGVGGGAINGGTSALVSDISQENKGADLSLLGVFFGAGALSMPFFLGFLQDYFSYEWIVSIVGVATLIVGVLFFMIQFPVAKQASGLPLNAMKKLMGNPFLLVVSYFLFFQSAFEGIINNWTPSYLTTAKGFTQKSALFALSVSVAGMVCMRLLLGSFFRNWKPQSIWVLTFLLLGSGMCMLGFSTINFFVFIGLFAVGAGLAAGFPMMLGMVGERFKELSGTAFSIAFTIALAGNMIFNYAMGLIAKHTGVDKMITVGITQWLLMGILCMLILRMYHKSNSEKY